MNFAESLTSFFANILDILQISDKEKDTINRKIVGASLAQAILELVKESPVDSKELIKKSRIDERAIGQVYTLLVARFGEYEVKKVLSGTFHANLVVYLDSISHKLSPEQKSEIESLIEESQVFDLLSLPKIFLDFLTG